MKALVWPIIASVGFAVMVWAYTSRDQIDDKTPWASGVIIMGSEMPVETNALAGAIPARLRLLSSSDVAEILLFLTGDAAPAKALAVKGQVRVKLIELPLVTAGIDASLLQSGRLPEPGRNEILAGARVDQPETRIVGGESLRVVGVLKPGVKLFANSLLVPPDDANGKLFPAVVPTVLHAWLVRSSPKELGDPEARKKLEAAFPPEKYGWVAPDDRLDAHSFFRYLAGLAIFLLGGSGMLIGLFRWLAGKAGPAVVAGSKGAEDPMLAEVAASKPAAPFLAGPLLEMKARPRLVWGVHLVYFGLVIAGSLLVFNVPEAQVVLLGKVREALATNSNPLGIAGEVYRSGNIALAAVVTFAVNFLLGSLAVITLPSIVLPGCGVIVAVVQALFWGLILAPTVHTLALGMLPRSLTLLLEGEGYILAALFGLLIPIYVVQRSLGGNLFTRFGRAILLNFKAQFWIALVLAVAAIYEATEVILMNR